MVLYQELAGGAVGGVLVHEAVVGDSRMWDPEWDPRSAHHRTLRLDLPGYGHSPLRSAR